MLIQMTGVFLFWWLLILAVGAVVVVTLDKFVLKPRRDRARAHNPFGLLLGQPQPISEPVEEIPVAVPAGGGEGPGQRRPLFQAPLPEPRRYFIGKGPVEDDKS